MEKEPLYDLLRKVRSRILLQKALRLALFGLLGGSVAGLLVLGISRLLPMLHAKVGLIAAIALGLMIGIAISIWRRPTMRDAARIIDDGGAEEAIVTALDGLQSKGFGSATIIRLQREAATQNAAAFVARLSERLPWPPWRSWRGVVASFVAVWLIIGASLLSPNPMNDKALAISKANAELEDILEKAEELKEEAQQAGLQEGDREKLTQTVDELRKELESLGLDPSDALQQLAETLETLKEMAEEAKAAAQNMEELANEISGEDELKDLANAIKSLDQNAVSQSIDRLRNEMQELSEEEREQLAALLESLADSAANDKGDESLQEALDQAAQQLRDGGGQQSAQEGGADGLAALEDALNSRLSSAALEELARGMASGIQQGGERLAESIAGQGGTIPSRWSEAAAPAGGSSGQASGEAGGGQSGSGGENSGEGQGSDSGQGTGSGSQGSGSGQGAGSEGQGSGTGQGTGSGGQGSGTGQGAGIGTGDRGLVTTPRHLEGEGTTEVDGGPTAGGETQTGGQSPTIDGTTRPYEDVYSEYAAEAKRSLGRTQLPSSLQDKVKQYFDEIQPDR